MTDVCPHKTHRRPDRGECCSNQIGKASLQAQPWLREDLGGKQAGGAVAPPQQSRASSFTFLHGCHPPIFTPACGTGRDRRGFSQGCR